MRPCKAFLVVASIESLSIQLQRNPSERLLCHQSGLRCHVRPGRQLDTPQYPTQASLQCILAAIHGARPTVSWCPAGGSVHGQGREGQPAAHQGAHLPCARQAPCAHHHQPGSGRGHPLWPAGHQVWRLTPLCTVPPVWEGALCMFLVIGPGVRSAHKHAQGTSHLPSTSWSSALFHAI